MSTKIHYKDILRNPDGAAVGAGQTVFEDPNGKPINRNNLTKKQQNELDIFLKHKQKEATELLKKTQKKANNAFDKIIQTPKSRKTNNQLKIKKN